MNKETQESIKKIFVSSYFPSISQHKSTLFTIFVMHIECDAKGNFKDYDKSEAFVFKDEVGIDYYMKHLADNKDQRDIYKERIKKGETLVLVITNLKGNDKCEWTMTWIPF